MADFLENLQSKPEKTRKFIAIGFALIITGVVLGAWLIVKNMYSIEYNVGGDVKENTASVGNVSPFSEIKNTITNIYKSYQEKFGK